MRKHKFQPAKCDCKNCIKLKKVDRFIDKAIPVIASLFVWFILWITIMAFLFLILGNLFYPLFDGSHQGEVILELLGNPDLKHVSFLGLLGIIFFSSMSIANKLTPNFTDEDDRRKD